MTSNSNKGRRAEMANKRGVKAKAHALMYLRFARRAS